jgi:hypothetical protein
VPDKDNIKEIPDIHGKQCQGSCHSDLGRKSTLVVFFDLFVLFFLFRFLYLYLFPFLFLFLFVVPLLFLFPFLFVALVFGVLDRRMTWRTGVGRRMFVVMLGFRTRFGFGFEV